MMTRLFSSHRWIAAVLSAVLLAGTALPVLRHACVYMGVSEDVATTHEHAGTMAHSGSTPEQAAASPAAHCQDRPSEAAHAAAEAGHVMASVLAAPSPATDSDCVGTCANGPCCTIESKRGPTFFDVYLPESLTSRADLLGLAAQAVTVSVSPDVPPPLLSPLRQAAALASTVRLHVWTATFLQ